MFQTQGRTHLERGQNFDRLLKRLGGPTRNTVSYVPGVAHDGPAMFQSDEGIYKVSCPLRVPFLSSWWRVTKIVDSLTHG